MVTRWLKRLGRYLIPRLPDLTQPSAQTVMACQVAYGEARYDVYVHEIPIISEAWRPDAIAPVSPDIYWEIRVHRWVDDLTVTAARRAYPARCLADTTARAICEDRVLFAGFLIESHVG